MKSSICFFSAFLILFAYTANLSAQTEISGGIVSGTWTKAGSPYMIKGDINIPPDGSLTIEPGVRIDFLSSISFVVQGSLTAEGTAIDSIFFTIQDTSGFWDRENFDRWWGGLRIIHKESEPDSSKLDYCKFEFSRAEATQYNMDVGGALSVEGFNKIRISNCLFENNTADGGDTSVGGALYIADALSVKVYNNIFRNNSANEGGAIAIMNSRLTPRNNSIEKNNAVLGGGYFVNGSELISIDDNFKDNSAVDNGGAVFIADWGVRRNINFVNTTFMGNYARQNGGAIEAGNITIAFTNCKFTANTCDWIGGAMNIYNNTRIDLINCDFLNNVAPIFGGVMGSYNSFIEIEGCTMSDNSAGVLGGAVHSDWSQLVIRNSIFERDSSGETGGAFWLWHCNAEFEDCYFKDNKAQFNYGAIGSDSTNIIIDNSNFISNRAVWGGAIGVQRGSLEMQYCSVDFNSGEHGGAVNVGWSDVDLYSCEFGQNQGIWGGAIDAFNCDMALDLCAFGGNHAEDIAGVLHYIVDTADFNDNVRLSILNSEFINNSSVNGFSSGFVRQYNSESLLRSVEVDNCIFDRNESGTNGTLRVLGGIPDVRITNSIFSNNITHASRSMVGIQVNCSGEVYNCLFFNNQPRGLIIHNQSDVNVTNCTFAGNTEAALDLRRGAVTRLTNSIMWDNGRTANIVTAQDEGSKLYINHCNIEYGQDSLIPSDSLSSVEWGVGNIKTDPRFTKIPENDFTLFYDSPCLEAGIVAIQVDGVDIDAPGTDINGNLRPMPVGTNPDMGAYESSVPASIRNFIHKQVSLSLDQNFPNPFAYNTSISWYQTSGERIEIDVLDINGRQLFKPVNSYLMSGEHKIVFDGSGLEPGFYLYRLRTRDKTITRKMQVIR